MFIFHVIDLYTCDVADAIVFHVHLLVGED